MIQAVRPISKRFRIIDETGKTFYKSRRGFSPTVINLPPGNYKFRGKFVPVEPLKYVINLPSPTKNDVIEPKLFFGKNPNTATINFNTHEITLSDKLMRYPLYVSKYVYYHELGHQFYWGEEDADLYAAKRMLEEGYNPSQVILASYQITKDLSRVDNITNKIIQQTT